MRVCIADIRRCDAVAESGHEDLWIGCTGEFKASREEYQRHKEEGYLSGDFINDAPRFYPEYGHTDDMYFHAVKVEELA